MATANDYMARFKANHLEPKRRRKSAAQQVKEERQKVIDELRSAMIEKKRTIPAEWEKGFLSAMSCIEQMR